MRIPNRGGRPAHQSGGPQMSRTRWLAALVVLLAPGYGTGPILADEPPDAVGLRMVGAFQGGPNNEGHKVRIEMEGGQTLEGLIDSQPFVVDGDLGRYTIWADKIRTIQFLKRSNVEDEHEPEPHPQPQPQPQPVRRNPQAMGMMAQGMMGGMGGGMMMQQPTLIRGKVTTTTGKVIIGDIHIRPNFSLTLDFGILFVAPEKLRTLTVIDAGADQQQQQQQPQIPPDAKNGPQNNATQGKKPQQQPQIPPNAEKAPQNNTTQGKKPSNGSR